MQSNLANTGYHKSTITWHYIKCFCRQLLKLKTDTTATLNLKDNFLYKIKILSCSQDRKYCVSYISCGIIVIRRSKASEIHCLFFSSRKPCVYHATFPAKVRAEFNTLCNLAMWALFHQYSFIIQNMAKWERSVKRKSLNFELKDGLVKASGSPVNPFPIVLGEVKKLK